MSEIKQLKRFIYSAMVTSGSGSQSFYIDAESREKADKRAANKESDGMYADDSEVTDLDALEYEDETTVDDFGDFPLISREQSLLAQLEAAQKELFDFHNQEFQQRLANAEHQLYMKDLAIHNIKASRKAQFRKRLAAEAELSAANEKLSKPVVLPDYRCSPDMHTSNITRLLASILGWTPVKRQSKQPVSRQRGSDEIYG
ncbi:TPA: hypothetical protein RY571_000611 [Yersinia enterocolitica]|nr:hypothetical protein [Yersinia enterocolitica]